MCGAIGIIIRYNGYRIYKLSFLLFLLLFEWELCVIIKVVVTMVVSQNY